MMKKKIIVLVLLLSMAGFAHAEFIVNGDFETGDGWSGWGAWGSGSGTGGWMSFFATIEPSGGSDGGQYMSFDLTAATSWGWVGAWNDGAENVPGTSGDTIVFDAQIRDTSMNSCPFNVFYTFFDAGDVKIDLDGNGVTTEPQDDRVFLEYPSTGDGLWSPVSGIQASENSTFPAGDGGGGAGDYGVYKIPTPLSGETIHHFDVFIGIDDAYTLDMDEVSLDIGQDHPVNVYPTDGAENVPINAVLEWAPPPAFTPIAYDAYISITDPNADKVKDQVVFHADQTTYDPVPDLAYDTLYYWRVNAYDPCDVIRSPGSVWTFTTWPVSPVFTTDAESTTVEEGSSAQFYVETPRSNTFQWYKEPATAVNDGDDGGDVSVVSDGTSSTLTISNAEQADEDYYYCVATGNGSTESNHARLLIKRLMGHWKFDAMSLNDAVAGNHGTLTDPNANNPPPPPPSGPTWFGPGILGGAIKLQTGELYIDIPNQEYFNFHAQGFTVSAWIKTEEADWGVVVSKTDRKAPRTGWLLHHNGNSAFMNLRENGEVSYNGEVADNEWHMLVGTYDGDTGMLSLYVDGVKRGEDGPIWTLTETDMALKIGTELASDHPGDDTIIDYDGLVDDVKIYSYAQDGYEVATEYTDIAGGSVCVEPVTVGDFNGDCVVNAGDLAEIALDWLRCNLIPTSACD
jgi:hypothetical protein